MASRMRTSDSYNRRLRGARGFTYVGLLMIVAILGIISAGTVSLGEVMGRRDAEDELLFVGTQFRNAFRSYYESTPAGQPRFPSALTDLLKDPRYPETRRHLRRMYIDPLTRKHDWVLVQAPEGGIMGVHSRFEGTPIKIAEFPEEFRAFENQQSYSQWIFFYR